MDPLYTSSIKFIIISPLTIGQELLENKMGNPSGPSAFSGDMSHIAVFTSSSVSTDSNCKRSDFTSHTVFPKLLDNLLLL